MDVKTIDTSKISALGEAVVLIEKLRNHIEYLEEQQNNYALDLWNGMEFILQDKKLFPTINKRPLKVYDPSFDEFTTIDFMADNIVCICAEPKKRKKHIYTYVSNTEIKYYTLNDNEMTFETLRKKLDKLSTHLVVVSKNAIASVKFYDKFKNELLILKPNYKFDALIKYKPKKISPIIGLENFIKVREGFENRILLHKRAFHYRNSSGL